MSTSPRIRIELDRRGAILKEVQWIRRLIVFAIIELSVILIAAVTVVWTIKPLWR